jgi:hypothetical protein
MSARASAPELGLVGAERGSAFLHLALEAIDLFSEEATDGVAVLTRSRGRRDWRRTGFRRIAPASRTPFTRHLIIQMVAQLLFDVQTADAAITPQDLWRRVVARLAPCRRHPLIARLPDESMRTTLHRR